MYTCFISVLWFIDLIMVQRNASLLLLLLIFYSLSYHYYYYYCFKSTKHWILNLSLSIIVD